MMDIFIKLLYVISTLAFCYGFATFSFAFLNKHSEKSEKAVYTLIFFFMDSICFVICEFLQLSIVLNWLIFAFIAFIQAFFILQSKFSTALFLCLQASLCGLNSNLFQRSLIAIILNIPLSSIDNSQSQLTLIPIISSFFTCFIIFILYSKEKRVKPLRHILQTPKHLKSLLLTMTILMAYLLLQNLLYVSDKNSISLKILSLLSCLYIAFGFLWSVKYTVRFSYLYYLDDQNITLRRILHDYKQQEQNLKQASNYDSLTGILSRHSGDNALNMLVENDINFCLCIIDLDGLKYVNDTLGHKYGDMYLKTISSLLKNNCRNNKDILFRYGGDEFVIAFVDMQTSDVHIRMQYIFEQVVKMNDISEFPMNISYGISTDSNLSLNERFDQADSFMYKMKAEHKKQNPNIVRN